MRERGSAPTLHGRILAVVLGMLWLGTTQALAEVAHLRNGRVLQISGYRLEGERVVLLMPGGGEVALPSDEVSEIRLGLPDLPPMQTTMPSPPHRAGRTGESPPGSSTSTPDRAARGDPTQPTETLPVGAVFDQNALRDLAGRLARRHGVDADLVQAVIAVESRYDAFAVSPRGAMGLMQLMPGTAFRFDVENAFDPVENVDAGVRYLKELLTLYGGQTRLALAAYNAGERAVAQHDGIPPYRETMQYVSRVLREARR